MTTDNRSQQSQPWRNKQDLNMHFKHIMCGLHDLTLIAKAPETDSGDNNTA